MKSTATKYLIIVCITLFLCCIVKPFHTQANNYIKVAVIDSGVNKISENIKEGFCAIDNTNNTVDNKGHGTYVASIILKYAPNATIVPIKVTELNLNLPNEYVANSIYKAVDDYDCDVINISIGMPNSEELKKAVDYAVYNGVIIVSAVGNDGEISYKKQKLYYPAAYNEVIGVGSVKDNLEISSFSQTNESVFITTNGEHITTGFAFENPNGTSFAAAKISGYAAILKGYNKGIDSLEFKKYLMENAIDKGDNGYDKVYGYGVLDESSYKQALAKDYPIFIKDYIEKDTKTTFQIYNGNDEPITGVLIKFFSDNKVESQKLKIEPGLEVDISSVNLEKCFFWPYRFFDIILIKK